MQYAVVAAITVLVVLFGIWLVGVAGEQITRGALATLVILATTLTVTALGWLVVWLWHVWQSIQRDRAATRQIQAEADRKERGAQFTVITAAAGEQVYLADMNHDVRWNAIHRNAQTYSNGQWEKPQEVELQTYAAYLASVQQRATTRAADAPQLAAPLSTPPDIMAATAEIERILVVGGSGSGKTTLLQWFTEARRGHQIIILDPHDDTRTWGDAQVEGGGQDYDSILLALTALAQDIQARYRLRATGAELTRENCRPLVLVIDEWREIVREVKEASTLMKACLTGGRKVSFQMIIGSHSARVGALGIKGEGDLIEGLAVARLRGGKGKPYSATLDIGDGPQPTTLPGPFVPGAALEPRGPVVDLGSMELPMTDAEREILSIWDGGARLVTRIGAEVYKSGGGNQNALVRDCLIKFGRIQ